jgi:molybdate transport system substrate-binding protein
MLGALAVALVGSGCGGPGARAAGTSRATVTVSAAASLTESFTQIGKDFERANPGVRVTFSFGGSSTLAQQITAGAPADVFAAASPATMKQVTDAGLAAGPPSVFTRNQLVLAVPKGNPKRIAGLTDLTAPGLKVALCAATVPCGAAAARALDAGGVRLTPVTLELDVKAALSKVRLGEVDAALVYRTDVRTAASGVDGVEFPESAKAVNDYPIVALAKGPNPVGAKAFVAYARSESAGTVLTRAGFQRP